MAYGVAVRFWGSAGEELDVRLGEPLTEIDGGMAGTLEVFHASAWGSVCVREMTSRRHTLASHVLFT